MATRDTMANARKLELTQWLISCLLWRQKDLTGVQIRRILIYGYRKLCGKNTNEVWNSLTEIRDKIRLGEGPLGFITDEPAQRGGESNDNGGQEIRGQQLAKAQKRKRPVLRGTTPTPRSLARGRKTRPGK